MLATDPRVRIADRPKGVLMPSRKLDELASDIDDASETVEEIQHTPGTDDSEKLADLHETLDKASEAIDELENDE